LKEKKNTERARPKCLRNQREREKKGKPPARGRTKISFRGLSFSPTKSKTKKKTNPHARLHAQRYNNNSANNNKKKKKKSDETKRGKDDAPARSRSTRLASFAPCSFRLFFYVEKLITVQLLLLF